MKRIKILPTSFLVLVIAPYSGYQLQKVVDASDEIKSLSSNHPRNHQMESTYEDLYPNYKLNMSKETQDTIYTDILQIIRAAQKISSKKEMSQKKKFPPKKVPSNDSTNTNYKISQNLVSHSHSKSPNSYMSVLKSRNSSKRVAESSKSLNSSSTKKELSTNKANSSIENMLNNPTDNDFLLGYSSNIFGSHTEYIEHVSSTSNVPR